MPGINVSGLGAGAASAITATLPTSAGQQNFLSHWRVSGLGATVGSVIQITITGLQGGNRVYDYTVPTGAGVAGPNLEVTYPAPIPASAAGVAIVINVPSFGAGNTASRAEADGVVI